MLALSKPPREILAVEIQESHCRSARSLSIDRGPRGSRVEITHADLFDLDLKRDLNWLEGGPLLVIGNPPWVTNSELGALGSRSRPPRRNFKGLSGMEARTGASNFDLAEAVWFKLVFELADQAPTIAILCKMSVARSLLQFAHRAGLPVIAASIHQIDAARWFGAVVGACLFQVTLGPGSLCAKVPVFSELGPGEPESFLGFARGWLIANQAEYDGSSFADGVCPVTWRQGIKHDAAAVMELVRDTSTGRLHNGAGEIVDVESEFVYPLIKGTDLNRPVSARPERAVVITQKRIGDDTTHLSDNAPGFGATCGHMAHGLQTVSRRSIAANPPSLSSELVHTASPRSKWRFLECTRLQGSMRWVPAGASPSCSMTLATSSRVPPRSRPPSSRRCATSRPRSPWFARRVSVMPNAPSRRRSSSASISGPSSIEPIVIRC